MTAVTLLPQRPASLTHKNPQRSIDRSEEVFVEYPVRVISVAVVKRLLFLLVFVVFYKGVNFYSVNCNTEFWSLSLD